MAIYWQNSVDNVTICTEYPGYMYQFEISDQASTVQPRMRIVKKQLFRVSVQLGVAITVAISDKLPLAHEIREGMDVAYWAVSKLRPKTIWFTGKVASIQRENTEIIITAVQDDRKRETMLKGTIHHGRYQVPQ